MMKKRLVFITAILALIAIGNSCTDTGECDADPEVCACIENPLRCVSPVGTTEEAKADSVEEVSELPVEE